MYRIARTTTLSRAARLKEADRLGVARAARNLLPEPQHPGPLPAATERTRPRLPTDGAT
jgi:hypothetical protein